MLADALAPPRHRTLIAGFIAGAVAVPLFHQPVLGLLHAAGIATRGPFSMQASAPLGVPLILSLTFWGGVWGVALVALIREGRARGRFLLLATVFGALLPTLVAWFVVAPMKGQHTVLSGRTLVTGLCVNAAWGLGTALLLKVLR